MIVVMGLGRGSVSATALCHHVAFSVPEQDHISNLSEVIKTFPINTKWLPHGFQICRWNFY